MTGNSLGKHIGLLHTLVSQCGYGLPLPREDQLSVAALALRRAIARHDPRRGTLSTLAATAIRRALWDECPRISGTVAIPKRERAGRVALDSPENPGDPTTDQIPDRAPLQDEEAHHAQTAAWVRQAVVMLPARQRAIIEARYGLNGDNPLTYQAIGDRLGLSAEQVRYVQRRALKGLRRALRMLAPDRPGTTVDVPGA
jgi:RNA polymerase sigma factor (sigma-70 family)